MTTVHVEAVSFSQQRHRIWWKAMARVTWLQHRATLIGISILAIGCAIAMLISQSYTHGAYATYVASGCVVNPVHSSCGTFANTIGNGTTSFSAIVIALHVLPVIIGLFVGAPLVAREIESGSYRYTWTQEVGRTRAVLTTFALLAVVVTTVACLLGLLLGWYGHPFQVVGVESEWQSGLFATTVFMLGAWTLFAFSVGTFLGALIGRIVAAMAATTVFIGGLLTVSFLYLVHWLLSFGAIATSKIVPNGMGIGALNDRDFVSGPPLGSWLVRGWITGPNGHVLSTKAAWSTLFRADNATQKNFSKNAVTSWLSLHHFTYWVSYQPSSRFWIFQLVAVAVLIGLAMIFMFGVTRALRFRSEH